MAGESLYQLILGVLGRLTPKGCRNWIGFYSNAYRYIQYSFLLYFAFYNVFSWHYVRGLISHATANGPMIDVLFYYLTFLANYASVSCTINEWNEWTNSQVRKRHVVGWFQAFRTIVGPDPFTEFALNWTRIKGKLQTVTDRLCFVICGKFRALPNFTKIGSWVAALISRTKFGGDQLNAFEITVNNMCLKRYLHTCIQFCWHCTVWQWNCYDSFLCRHFAYTLMQCVKDYYRIF